MDQLKYNYPVLSDQLIEELNIQDQAFSVEASLETLIPWIEYITDLSAKRVLVFGTGGGGTAIALALKVGDGLIYGVDINEWAINTTKRKSEEYGVSLKLKLFHLSETFPLPFNNEYFDIIVLADVIEHIVDERGKYLRDNFKKLKKGGLLVITGTPNLLYPYDFHTTKLFLIPWMTSNMAHRYATLRGKWEEHKDLDYAGRRGTTFWHIKKWLKEENYEIINLRKNFNSIYLLSHNRINSKKRKLLFRPYKLLENFCSKFKIPITAFLPYINHLFIIKK